MNRPKFVTPWLKAGQIPNTKKEPETKKPRLEEPEPEPAIAKTGFQKPLLALESHKCVAQEISQVPNANAYIIIYQRLYNVLWRKQTNKKNKTWDGDGILVVDSGYCTLQDLNGKDLGKALFKSTKIDIGDVFTVGGKDVEIESFLKRDDYMPGRQLVVSSSILEEPLNPLNTIPPANGFKNPLKQLTDIPKSHIISPRHDPNAYNALVMPRPRNFSGYSSYQRLVDDRTIVDVVVDPFLSQKLRPHQREGVKFLYECVMGMKDYVGHGAILADEMGLGKTLQTIALLWTLLKQNPFPNQGPIIKRALIVCPVTLINNWKREFRKWLGNERLGVFVVDSKANVNDFKIGRIYQVMIIGYEKLRIVQDDLKKANIDIIICDEGHRLKSASNKSAQAIRALNTPRRVILSGTPVQNDLCEFFVMVDFVNPGIVESYSTFKKEFENPIIKSRQPGAVKKDKQIGKARSEQLTSLTSLFILRRTAEILFKYLPPKVEYVVFCKPTNAQVTLYSALLASSSIRECISGIDSPAHVLQAITALKKVCNCPSLVTKYSEGDPDFEPLISHCSYAPITSGKLAVLDSFLQKLYSDTDEKIVLVSNYTQTLDLIQDLLKRRGMSFLRLDGSTANSKRQELVDKFNRSNRQGSFAFLLSSKSGGLGLNLVGASRLILFDTDWNPSVDLQAMARVHRDGQKRRVFIYRLLTLSLIKRYMLMKSTGMIDEKIYQRQITKQSLSDSFMDAKANSSGNSFSLSELRDLFTLHQDTLCHTHDLLGCTCLGNGERRDVDVESDDERDEDECLGFIPASQAINEMKHLPCNTKMNALREYLHISPQELNESELDELIEDEILNSVIKSVKTESGQFKISYLFTKYSTTPSEDPKCLE